MQYTIISIRNKKYLIHKKIIGNRIINLTNMIKICNSIFKAF